MRAVSRASNNSQIQVRQRIPFSTLSCSANVSLIERAVAQTCSAAEWFPERHSMSAYALYRRRLDDLFFRSDFASFLDSLGLYVNSRASVYSARSSFVGFASTSSLRDLRTQSGSVSDRGLVTALIHDLKEENHVCCPAKRVSNVCMKFGCGKEIGVAAGFSVFVSGLNQSSREDSGLLMNSFRRKLSPAQLLVVCAF